MIGRLTTFDPSKPTVNNGGFFQNTMQNGMGWLEVTNESMISLIFTIGDKQFSVPAGVFTILPVKDATQLIYWAQDFVFQNVGQAPSSLVVVDFVTADDGDYVKGKTYPMVLPRLSNVGNSIGSGMTTSLIVDGQAAGFIVVEATPTGASGSELKLTNEGAGVLAGGHILLSNTGVMSSDGTGSITGSMVTSIPLANLQTGALPAGITLPAAQVTGTVANAQTAQNISNILQADNNGSSGTTQIIRLKTNSTGTNHYNFHVVTYDLGSPNDVLLVDNLGVRYADLAGLQGSGPIPATYTVPPGQVSNGALGTGVTIGGASNFTSEIGLTLAGQDPTFGGVLNANGYAILSGKTGVAVETNVYFDNGAAADKFIATSGNYAMQLTLDPISGNKNYRRSTNTPTAGAAITWGTLEQVATFYPSGNGPGSRIFTGGILPTSGMADGDLFFNSGVGGSSIQLGDQPSSWNSAYTAAQHQDYWLPWTPSTPGTVTDIFWFGTVPTGTIYPCVWNDSTLALVGNGSGVTQTTGGSGIGNQAWAHGTCSIAVSAGVTYRVGVQVNSTNYFYSTWNGTGAGQANVNVANGSPGAMSGSTGSPSFIGTNPTMGLYWMVTTASGVKIAVYATGTGWVQLV